MKAQLSFQVDQAATAGERLAGTLHITVGKPIKASHLELSFDGEEYAQLKHRRGVNPIKHYHECRQLVHLSVPTTQFNDLIQRGNNTVVPGHYEIPFSLLLPSHLPYSMAGEDCNSCTKIEYRLHAELVGSGVVQDYQAHQIVQVNAMPRLLPVVPYMADMLSQRIDVGPGGMLRDKGRVTVGAQVLDTHFIPGQQMNLAIAVLNESPVSIRRMHVVLQEKVELTVRGDGNILHTTSRTRDLMEQDFSGLAKAPSCKKRNSKTVSDDDMDRSFEAVAKQLESRDNMLYVTLPPLPSQAHSSYNGPFVNVSHELTVTLITPMTCNNIEFSVPVQFYENGVKMAKEVPYTVPRAA